MNKTDLKAGDTLVDFQKGYAKEFKVVQENNELFLESRESRQKIQDYDFKGCHLLITSNDRIEV